ncbi:MAG: hypothetical protein RBU27_12800 [Bacteroidota bacterium]|jgi:hypothetical protein|nr:hypothetical protein [Bacteroidota bacterium]
MSSHIDIIGSVIIAGMIILNFSFFMGERTESQIESTNKITAQTEMSDVTQTLRYDLRKVGYGCDSVPILRADETSFVFRADLENDGTLDTIGYYYGAGATLIGETSAPLLYRVVNGHKQAGQDVGINHFRFLYFDVNSYGALTATTTIESIRAIGVQLRLRSRMKEEGEYTYSNNEFTISPKNL